MKVLITRALEDAEPLAQLLESKGVSSLVDPMLRIDLIAGDPLSLTNVQALLMTSANGVRAFAARNSDRQLPVYAVGDATMREAKTQGFTQIETASGDVDALADLVGNQAAKQDGVLLHCAGTKTAGDLGGSLQQAGYAYRREVVYRAVATERLSEITISGLKAGQLDGVLLYSPRTASVFKDCIHRANCQLELANLRAFCLSQAVATQIKDLDWAAIEVAQAPTQKSLLEIVLDRV